MFYLWPENVETWYLWLRLQSMWRISLQGHEGLDWPSVVSWLRHAERMRAKEVASTMHALRVMEVSSLNVWARLRELRAAKYQR